MFERLFFSVFRYYRLKGSKRSITNAVLYLTLLQAGLLLNAYIFIAVLTKRLPHDLVIRFENYLILIVVIALLYLINSLQYSGRNLSLKRARQKPAAYQNMTKLWLVPIMLVLLAIILYHAA